MAIIPIPQPAVSISQVFTSTSTELTTNLRGFIFGPEYRLHRYATSAEKVLAGAYNPVSDTVLSFANLGREAGATVDQAYTTVNMENLLLSYYDREVGGGEGATSAQVVPGSSTSVRMAGLVMVTANGLNADPIFQGRSVQIGDFATLNLTVGTTAYTVTGEIINFIADIVPASVGAASADANNPITQSASGPTPVIVPGSGATGNLTIGGTYNALSTGVLNETYTVTAVRGSVGQNPASMVLNVTSLSGTDNHYGVVPSTSSFATAFPLGVNGLAMAFTGYSGDIPAGASWTVSVGQAFTAPTAESATGTYSGTTTTTYILTVVTGGDTSTANLPVVAVSTSTGVDGQAPRTLSSLSNIQFGNQGVSLTISGSTALAGGSRFYVVANAATKGATSTFVLDAVIPAAMRTAADIGVQFSISENILLPQTLPLLSITNWTSSGDTVTLKAGAFAYTPAWHNGTVALPVTQGDIYLTWREQVLDHADQIYSLAPSDDLTSLFSTQIDPDNPLVFACLMAQLNSASGSSSQAGLRVMGTVTNDIPGFATCLAAATNRTDCYFLVPLTRDPAIMDVVMAHVNTQSTPVANAWCVALFGSSVTADGAVVAGTPTAPNLATVDATKALVSVTTGVDFIVSGVRSGDSVRLNFGTDGEGNPTYSTYVVDRVLSRTSLLLLLGPPAPITIASKFEIWRTYTANDIVTSVTDQAAHFNSRRAMMVFPDNIPYNGKPVPSYFACAAIAGLASSMVPQQGLSTLRIVGFDNMNQVVNGFSRSQLNTMAGGGVFILTQNLDYNVPVVRHQLMTLTDTLLDREFSNVKNADSCSYYVLNVLKPFRGRSNVTQGTLTAMQGQLNSAINFLQATIVSPLLGGQLMPGSKIVQLQQDPTSADSIIIILDFALPQPSNYTNCTIIFSPGIVPGNFTSAQSATGG